MHNGNRPCLGHILLFDIHWTIPKVNHDSVALSSHPMERKYRQSACSFLCLQGAMLASGIQLVRRWNDATSANHQTTASLKSHALQLLQLIDNLSRETDSLLVQ